MNAEILGSMEARTLVAVRKLGRDAYGIKIHTQVKEFDQKKPTTNDAGNVYIVLDRLVAKGYCESERRDGRPKRYFRLTSAGEQALANWKAVTENVLREIRS